MTRSSYLATKPIMCDQCRKHKVCLYTYEDPVEDFLPMIFCSIDCLTHYVVNSPQGSELIPQNGLLLTN